MGNGILADESVGMDDLPSCLELGFERSGWGRRLVFGSVSTNSLCTSHGIRPRLQNASVGRIASCPRLSSFPRCDRRVQEGAPSEDDSFRINAEGQSRDATQHPIPRTPCRGRCNASSELTEALGRKN